jgi:hypothetical protein
MYFLFSASASSENVSSLENISKYVSVTVEINELDESTNILKEAMTTLSLSLKEAAKSPENLSVEQLQELGTLIDKSDDLVVSLERTLQEVNPAINSAKKPTKDLLSALLQTARIEAVEPTIKSISSTVQFWLLLIIIGGILIVAFISITFYYTTKQFREMAQVLKSITNEYEIVRRK